MTTLPGLPPWSRARRAADYGGYPDKMACDTESTPYAWTWYRELRAMRGSAYSQKSSGYVHAENLAIARSEAARTRAAEKLVANSLPGTADERLAYWVTVLQVTCRPTDSDYDIRTRAAAQYKLAVGPTIANEDQAILELLGSAFVRCWRQEGVDLATPPPQTFWRGGTIGPPAYSLSGDEYDTWLSERAHLVVEVQQPAWMTATEFLELMNVHLFRLLDDMLPAWATFNWAIGVTTGFLLDIDEMDYHGMN